MLLIGFLLQEMFKMLNRPLYTAVVHGPAADACGFG